MSESEEVTPDEADEIESTDVALGSLDFEGLSSTAFEEFSFDLMSTVGFVNVDWRKGTPLPASPSDSGRDIVAQREQSDADGHRYTETWFVDCKHYKRGVPPDALQSTLAWAQAERPAVVLFIASGYLSNGANDWLAAYERENRPAFRIRSWEKPQLLKMVESHLDVAFKHDVALSTLRRVSEILEAESDLTVQLWYGRKPADEDLGAQGLTPETIAAVLENKRAVEDEFGQEVLDRNVETDWNWGYLSGRVLPSGGCSATSGTCLTANSATSQPPSKLLRVSASPDNADTICGAGEPLHRAMAGTNGERLVRRDVPTAALAS